MSSGLGIGENLPDEVSERFGTRISSLDYRALFEGLMGHIPEGITIAAAPDVKIMAVSRFGQETLCRSEAELTGKTAEDHPDQWDILRPDGVTRPKGEELPLTRATVNGEIVINEPWLLRRPDGKAIHILCNAGPIRDESGMVRWGVIAWRDVTKLREVEEALEEERRKSQSYKELLLQETAHRIKNNLAFIASILKFEARRSGDMKAKKVLEESAKRMVALGNLYDGVGHSPTDRTNAQVFLSGLSRSLQNALSQPQNPLIICAKSDDIELSSSAAFDLGMIVNELVTNAYKYGGSDDGTCRIDLSFRCKGHQGELIVADRGPGLPPGFAPHETGTLGMTIVRSLAGRLQGEISTENASGARFRLRFPLDDDTAMKQGSR